MGRCLALGVELRMSFKSQNHFFSPSYFPKRITVASVRAATLLSLPYHRSGLENKVEALCAQSEPEKSSRRPASCAAAPRQH